MGLQSLLTLNFHSCSFRVVSDLSKTARVGASTTSAGNLFQLVGYLAANTQTTVMKNLSCIYTNADTLTNKMPELIACI